MKCPHSWACKILSREYLSSDYLAQTKQIFSPFFNFNYPLWNFKENKYSYNVSYKFRYPNSFLTTFTFKHLQVICLLYTLCWRQIILINSKIIYIMFKYVEPVSYTHLDVYKRQGHVVVCRVSRHCHFIFIILWFHDWIYYI